MKKVKGYRLRTVMDQSMLVWEGAQKNEARKLIALNASAAMLWNGVGDRDFTVDDMALLLQKHYDIDSRTALDDAAEMARLWIENGLVTE